MVTTTDKKYSLSLITFVYNEELLLEKAVLKWIQNLNKFSNDYEIIIVDDGSEDKTPEIAENLADRFSLIKVLHHRHNMGVGQATVTGLKEAGKEIIFWAPIDGSFDTQDLAILLPCLDDADIAVGVRKNRLAHSLYRRITSLVNYYLIRLFFRVPLRDFQHIQLYKREIFKNFRIKSRSTFVPPECLIKAYYLGYKIKEIMISFHPRKTGKAKCGAPTQILKTLMDMIKIRYDICTGSY